MRYRTLLAGAVATGLAVSSVTVAATAGTAEAMITPVRDSNGPGADPVVTKDTVAETSSMPRQLIVPDLLAALPSGLSAAQLTRIRKLAGVRAIQAVSGGGIKINGRAATVLGASAAQLREWTPPSTAGANGIWDSFARGDLITTTASAKRLGVRAGGAYQVAAAITTSVAAGPATSSLGLPGIDAVVTTKRAAQLGLIRDVAVLINAPGASLTKLQAAVASVVGSRGHVVRLVPITVTENLPVDNSVSVTATPTSYVQLYQESAALYCPGLSWTVLAAIGEIESGNGTNDGPSSAGALGPMQFMPSTWAIWGTDAFGQTGAPNIMNPLDAVPSAARMLCYDGAAAGGASLSQAIYDYNHATWYVTEVLDLAAEYAREYPS